MTRSRLVFFLLSSVVVIALLGGNLLGASAGADDPNDDSLYKHLSVFTEVLGLIRQAYVDDTGVDSLMAGALDGATDALDPLSIYVPADEVGRYVQAREIGNRYTGLTLVCERGVAFVVAVDPGSPAAEAGRRGQRPGGEDPGAVHPDDAAVADPGAARRRPRHQDRAGADPGGRDPQGDLRAAAVRAAAGELRGRDRGGGAGAGDAAQPVGVLRVARFEPSTAAAVRQVVAGAARDGRDRLVIDLRGVAGGDPAAAYAVAELFAQGELGRLERKGDRLESFAGDAEPVWQGHLVVLVSRGTLGAAEVLATVSAPEGGRRAGRRAHLRLGRPPGLGRPRQRRPPVLHRRLLHRPRRRAALRRASSPTSGSTPRCAASATGRSRWAT